MQVTSTSTEKSSTFYTQQFYILLQLNGCEIRYHVIDMNYTFPEHIPENRKHLLLFIAPASPLVASRTEHIVIGYFFLRLNNP